MPVRNEGNHIARSVTAVLDQDYPTDWLEVLVADGRSTDDTRDRIAALADADPRLHLVDNVRKRPPAQPGPRRRHGRGGDPRRRPRRRAAGLRAPVRRRAPRVRCRLRRRGDRHGRRGHPGPGHRRRPGVALRRRQRRVPHRFEGGPGGRHPGVRRLPPFGVRPHRHLRPELVRNQDDEFNYRLTQSGGTIWLDPSIISTYYSRATFKRRGGSTTSTASTRSG